VDRGVDSVMLLVVVARALLEFGVIVGVGERGEDAMWLERLSCDVPAPPVLLSQGFGGDGAIAR